MAFALALLLAWLVIPLAVVALIALFGGDRSTLMVPADIDDWVHNGDEPPRERRLAEPEPSAEVRAVQSLAD